MTFNVLEWLISKSLDLSAAKSFAKLNNLQSRLNKAVDDWAKKLPVSAQLVSVSIYFEVHSNNRNDKALKLICQKLEKNQLPSSQLLLDALYEKWNECKVNGADQPFFLIDEISAKFYLNSLASTIHSLLVQENNLFNNFVHAQLLHLRSENKEIHKILKSLEALIVKNELSIKPNKKTFRPIPDCRIPIWEDEELRKILIRVFFKISLFKTFQSCKYHKFTCLIAFGEDAFYIGDQDMPGLTLFCGEVDFLSNLRNIIDLFLRDPQQFEVTMNSFYSNPNFEEFKLTYQLLCEGINAYEIEVDGSAKRFAILRKVPLREIDYDHMNSFNSALLMIPTFTSHSLLAIDIDKIKVSSAMTKFIYCCLLEDTIELDRLRINVDDFDDWDFEYTLPSKDK